MGRLPFHALLGLSLASYISGYTTSILVNDFSLRSSRSRSGNERAFFASNREEDTLSLCEDPTVSGSEMPLLSRREFGPKFFAGAALGSLIATKAPAPANASGGATAGGVYLLSAKQRYNQRVEAGIKSFLALSSSLQAGDLAPAKSFFDGEEVGSWKDASTAGYLLANAFRRSSTTPPDSLPSVKKWKAFQADVKALEKAVTKKKASDAAAAYAKAEESLDAYLDAVELPPVAEMRQK